MVPGCEPKPDASVYLSSGVDGNKCGMWVSKAELVLVDS